MNSLEVVLRAIASLIVVVGLIVWLGKRFNGDGSGALVARFAGTPNSTKKKAPRRVNLSSLFPQRSPKSQELITVVGRQALVGRTSIAVVDVDGQRLVLGITDSAVSLLQSRDVPVVPHAELAPEVPELISAQAVAAPEMAVPEPAATEPKREVNQHTQPRESLEICQADSNTQGGNETFAKALDNAIAEATPRASHSRMDGSILSPNTWRQAKAAMKVARVGGNKTTEKSQHWS